VSQHRTQLDVVISGWIALDSTTFRPVVLFPDSIVTNDGKSHRDMAMVTSYQGVRFHPETVRGLATDSTALGHTAGEIASLVQGAGYSGIVLDLEGMTPNDFPALLALTKAVADSAHAHGVAQVGLAIPATDTAAYPARPLLAPLDFLVVMLYDQHWLTSPPGPIAAPDWVRRVLGVRIGEVGPSKLVVAFPTYGYQWRPDSATAVLSYDDARQRATGAQVGLERDPTSIMLHTQAAGWTIWVSDAVLLDSLVRDARISGVAKFALWRLGLEDPAVWTHVIR
jgi:spore germination protein YaaH